MLVLSPLLRTPITLMSVPEKPSIATFLAELRTTSTLSFSRIQIRKMSV